MEKKSFIVGILCLIAAFYLFFKQNVEIGKSIENQPTNAEMGERKRKNGEDVLKSGCITETNANLSVYDKMLDCKINVNPDRIFAIENDVMIVRVAIDGGGIASVELKKFQNDVNRANNWEFNKGNPLPALTTFLDKKHIVSVPFDILNKEPDCVSIKAKLSDGTIIKKSYKLNNGNNYSIDFDFHIEQPINNEGRLSHASMWFYLGLVQKSINDISGEYLNFFAHKNDLICHHISDFEASNGFLGIGKRACNNFLEKSDNYDWYSLSNQFFSTFFTVKGSNKYVALTKKIDNIDTMQGFVNFKINSKCFDFKSSYYVGPKNYFMLSELGSGQDAVMQFGIFGAISKLLLIIMHAIYNLIKNWGLTIIILTILVKLLMWPITNWQLRSSKKMNAIQGDLRELKEKYKNNPKKIQEETMALFKANKINPALGCLPVFIQIPIFISFYYLLRTAYELRFAQFLWVKDLTAPDTVFNIGNCPVNILPIIMTITMIIQMKVTPTTSDNTQKNIMLIMPIVFLYFCYNFPSALMLYWTIQNLFTIFQQFITNRYNKKIIA